MSEKLLELNAGINAERERNQRFRKRVLIILAILLAFTVGILITLHQLGYIMLPGERPANLVAGNVREGTLEHLNDGDLLAYMQQQVDASHVAIQLNTAPVFHSGTAAGNLLIQNAEANLYDMQVNIYLGEDSNGTLVYDSGLIAPGYYIDEDTLTTVLDKGVYGAIAYVSFYDGGNHITTVSADLVLTIQH